MCNSGINLPTLRKPSGYTAILSQLLHTGAAAFLFLPMKIKHGQSRTAVYHVWSAMLDRCRNPRNRFFHHYGGRGITVCERWRLFENFIADMGPRPTRGTLERKDVHAGYSPDNCVWATHTRQQRNRRDSRFMVLNGERLQLNDWADKFKRTSIHTIASRLYRGVPPELAVIPHDPERYSKFLDFSADKVLPYCRFYSVVYGGIFPLSRTIVGEILCTQDSNLQQKVIRRLVGRGQLIVESHGRGRKPTTYRIP